MSSALIANAGPFLLALIGVLTFWRSRRRDATEVTSLSQDLWFKEFARLEQRAIAADERATLADQRADTNEAALREAHRQLAEIQNRMAEIRRELDEMRLREQVLVEALVENGIEPNGWIERRMREIEATNANHKETP